MATASTSSATRPPACPNPPSSSLLDPSPSLLLSLSLLLLSSSSLLLLLLSSMKRPGCHCSSCQSSVGGLRGMASSKICSSKWYGSRLHAHCRIRAHECISSIPAHTAQLLYFIRALWCEPNRPVLLHITGTNKQSSDSAPKPMHVRSNRKAETQHACMPHLRLLAAPTRACVPIRTVIRLAARGAGSASAAVRLRTDPSPNSPAGVASTMRLSPVFACNNDRLCGDSRSGSVCGVHIL